MSKELRTAVDSGVDLYDLLGMHREELAMLGGCDKVSPQELRARYRQLALRYHPDKARDQGSGHGHANEERFHAISVAFQVLGDPGLKAEYDRWYRRRFSLRKPDKSRAARRRVYKNGESIVAVQQYGETLRKMKHFNLPFGDWHGELPDKQDGRETGTESEAKQEGYDCTTLRMELHGSPADLTRLSRESHLIHFLIKHTPMVPQDIHGAYYSSRNDPQQGSLVAYAEITAPTRSLALLHAWEASPLTFATDTQVSVVNMGPRIPVHYYHDIDIGVTDLNPAIQSALRGSAGAAAPGSS